MAQDSGARTLLIDAPRKGAVPELLRAAPAVEHVVVVGDPDEPAHQRYESLALAPPTTEMAPSDDLDAAAWMVYTSGTTGRPKGVLLSQRSCLWVVSACWAPIVGLDASDYMLSPLPLFHSYAIVLSILGVVTVGARAHIMERFSTPEVLDLLAAEPFTLLPGVPTMFHYLSASTTATWLGCETLRSCISAGAILPADLTAQFEAQFGVPLLDGYGITETSTMVTMNWREGNRPRGSCGLPLPGSAVRLVDPITGEDVPVGSDGEIWVRGPQVMLGYHERPEATAQALAGGWYHTGDVGRADRDGYLTITGRIKEMIIRGGENIYPAEVESVLLTHPHVRDCAVVGQPHDKLGETVVAFVVAEDRAAFDIKSLKAHCRDLLLAFKVPAEATCWTRSRVPARERRCATSSGLFCPCSDQTQKGGPTMQLTAADSLHMIPLGGLRGLRRFMVQDGGDEGVVMPIVAFLASPGSARCWSIRVYRQWR